jgi:hypothetical protein
MDAITVLTIVGLCISEILPLIHNTTANGILHFLLVTCKDIIEVIEKKEVVDTKLDTKVCTNIQDGNKSTSTG